MVRAMVKIAEDYCDDSCIGATISADEIAQCKLAESDANYLADWFKALGDPTRIKLIHALLKRELCVHDLSLVLGMGQSAVSHQLRYLRNVRMVKRRKAGKTVYYSLDDAHVEQIFEQTLAHLKHN